MAVSFHRRAADVQLDVNGQVFPTDGSDESTYRAVLLRGMKEAGRANADDLGEFRFEAIAPGDYFIVLSSVESSVVVVPLQVAA